MLPLAQHPNSYHASPGTPSEKTPNAVAGKSAYVVDVEDYELYRTMLYALGAKSVANKLMATADLIILEVPLVDGSLHATHLHWLGTSEFVRGFTHKQHEQAVDAVDPGILVEIQPRALRPEQGLARTGMVNGAAVSRVWT